nr:MAG TPA: 43 kDa tail protein [Bacteriophage sp.]
MDSKISLVVFKTGSSSGKDITGLVETIKWAGRRGSPTRTLTISLLDDDGYKHARSEIDIEQGYQCIFKYDGKELFRGIFLHQAQRNAKTGEYKAYDLGIYLSNNKDTFVYENKTATDVFKDVCSRFGIPVGEAAQTSYTIPDLTKKKTTGWDAIEDALSLDYDNTGAKHYVFSDKGQLYLKKRLENVLQWVLETGANITNYSYSKSLEKVKTRVKLYSSEGTVIAQEQDTSLESKIGIFQDIDTPDESLTTAQIKTLAKTMLQENKACEHDLSLNDVLGITDVISGVAVFIKVDHLGLNRTFYVDSDTHTFKGNLHTMSLSLNLVPEVSIDSTPEQTATQSKTYKKGDVVQFNGGYHYVSSTASKPTGSKCAAGPAKITYTAAGAAHPWHLVHTDGQSRVYGWVDDGTFS